MKKVTMPGISLLLAATVALASCATTGGGGTPAFHESIKQTAESLAAILPEGSRVAVMPFEAALRIDPNYKPARENLEFARQQRGR